MAALERFGRGAVRHVSAQVRAADDASVETLERICHAIGPSIILSLAELLAAEQDSRSRRRLRHILVGFGARGRNAVQQLMNAPNSEVRRIAAYVLGEVGGGDWFKDLERLLRDPAPLVQREALHAVLGQGRQEAYAVLLRCLSDAGRPRDTLIREVASLRDERAAPLLCYLVRHLGRRAQLPVYRATVEALGAVGGPGAIEALKESLYRRDWWSPWRTQRARALAAGALRRIGTPEALEVLRQATRRGPRGVRLVARAQLGRAD